MMTDHIWDMRRGGNIKGVLIQVTGGIESTLTKMGENMRGIGFEKESKKSGFKHVTFEMPIRNLWQKRVNYLPNQFSSTYAHNQITFPNLLPN